MFGNSKRRITPWCGNCRFWTDKHGVWRNETLGLGECRRGPPTVVPSHDKEAPPITMFPQTLFRDWCGQWQLVEAIDHQHDYHRAKMVNDALGKEIYKVVAMNR